MVTLEELQDMADFFSKHLFGIRYKGEIDFMDSKFEDDYTGELKKNPFIGSFEHHENSFDTDLESDDCFDLGICRGEDEYTRDCEYVYDYKPNVEDCSIYISKSIKTDRLRVIDTLLHELIHFTLWYQGLDHKDGEYQFEQALKKYGISSNYDRVFDGKTKKWKDTPNLEKLKEYENMYIAYVQNK